MEGDTPLAEPGQHPRTRCVYVHMYLLRGATPPLRSLGNTPFFCGGGNTSLAQPGQLQEFSVTGT